MLSHSAQRKILFGFLLFAISYLALSLPNGSLSAIHKPAFAASSGIEVSPAYLEVAISEDGERKDVPITLTNKTDREVTLDIYPLDFLQKDEMGTIGFLGQDNSYSYSLSSFLSFATRQVILEPGEKKDVLVTITNRHDLSPGGHYAAVIAREARGEGDSEDKTRITPSIASLLLIHKEGGERFNASLIQSSWPKGLVTFSYPKFFTMTIQNAGNIHITPYGRVEVRDLFGRLLEDGSINPNSLVVLPESRRIIDVFMTPLAMSLPISLNTISIKGHDSLNKTSFELKDSFFYVHPLVPVVILAVLILLGFIKFKKRKR